MKPRRETRVERRDTFEAASRAPGQSGRKGERWFAVSSRNLWWLNGRPRPGMRDDFIRPGRVAFVRSLRPPQTNWITILRLLAMTWKTAMIIETERWRRGWWNRRPEETGTIHLSRRSRRNEQLVDRAPVRRRNPLRVSVKRCAKARVRSRFWCMKRNREKYFATGAYKTEERRRSCLTGWDFLNEYLIYTVNGYPAER